MLPLLFGLAALVPLLLWLAWWLTRGRNRERPARDRSPAVLAIGAALVLACLAAGLLVQQTEERELPEQRGIGIVPSREPEPNRGLVATAAVRIRSCDEPVSVQLNVSGSAEYWLDHASALSDGGELRVGIPDLDLRDIRVGLGDDGKLAAVAPFSQVLQEDPRVKPLPEHGRKLKTVTELAVRIDGWGTHLRPVVFEFEADWLSSRNPLGSCYLRLPALAGPATVLTAQEVADPARVRADLGGIDCDVPRNCNIVRLYSQETKLRAYYRAGYETTRGIAAVALGDHSIKADLSQPDPNTNVGGIPAWACKTTALERFHLLGEARREERPEVLEGEEQGSGAYSVDRLAEAPEEQSCATFAVLEASSFQVRRDVLLLIIGVLLGSGVGFAIEFVRGRKRD